MLVLSRRRHETIEVGGGLVTFRILDVKRGVVSIGIDAPKELTVWRGEVAERMKELRNGDSK